MKRRINNLRLVGFIEGISFLILLFIAMPLKYFLEIPEAVKFTGWIHGVLFIAYIAAVFLASKVMKWNLLWVLIALVASLIPFGTFAIDRFLKRRLDEISKQEQLS